MGGALSDAGSATALIPGDPDALNALASSFSAFSVELGDGAQIVAAAQVSTSWSGVAASTFEAAQKEQPSRLTGAADSFHAAAGALRSYANALADAQRLAGVALRTYQDAEHQSARWDQANQAARRAATATSPAPDPGADPGAAGRQQAESMLDSARADLGDAAAVLVRALDHAKGAAPKKPGFFSRLWHDATHLASDVWHDTEQVGNWLWQHGGEQIANTVEYALQHPLDDLHLLGDAGLEALGILGLAATGLDEAAGVALDATGVGAIVGVPVNIAGVALATVSVGAMAGGAIDAGSTLSRMYNEANADDDSGPTPPSGSDGGPGEWKPVNRGPDEAPWKYQRQLNGTPLGPNGEQYEYEVNGVHFDGYDPGPPPTLLEAKGAYARLLGTDFARDNIRANFVTEARRQLEAAGGHDVTWVCSEPETAAVIRQLFEGNDIDGIKVVVQAPK